MELASIIFPLSIPLKYYFSWTVRRRVRGVPAHEGAAGKGPGGGQGGIAGGLARLVTDPRA